MLRDTDEPIITLGDVKLGNAWDSAAGIPTAPGRLYWEPGPAADDVRPRLQTKLFPVNLDGLIVKVQLRYKDAWGNDIPASSRTHQETVVGNFAEIAIDFDPFWAPNIYGVRVTVLKQDGLGANTYTETGSYDAAIW